MRIFSKIGQIEMDLGTSIELNVKGPHNGLPHEGTEQYLLVLVNKKTGHVKTWVGEEELVRRK